MLKQNITLNQKQSLKISPRQIQFLHFLQLNAEEVEDRIKEELETNPMLELAIEENPDTVLFPFQSRKTSSQNIQTFDSQQANATNIRTELKEQFRYTVHCEEEGRIADFIIDSVDEKGFLKNSVDELEDILSFGLRQFLESDTIKRVLKKIGDLQPLGVGSPNLQNYLLNQAKVLNFDTEALGLLENYLGLLGKHKYDEIMMMTGLSHASLKVYLTKISSLKPYPFYGIDVENLAELENVIPEYMVELREGCLVFGTLSKVGKKLVFNEYYGLQFSSQKDKSLSKFLLHKKDTAIWFIHALEEREKCMNVCIQAVVGLQEEYFKSGNSADLRPMILKDVATITGKTISSISRVTSQKYVQTHFGLVSMKSLFTEGIQRYDGQLISNKEVQEIVSNLVVDENKQYPLTDVEICDKVALNGFALTRRTITKYRECMNIPVSKLRRVL